MIMTTIMIMVTTITTITSTIKSELFRHGAL
jgi:hypothetical protein